MKKFLPFVFPAVAFLIVLFLAFRWYSLQSETNGQISSNTEGVQIEDLTESERDSVLSGVGDFETVVLESEEPETAQGQVRYEVQDDKVTFSVMSGLPQLEAGFYQVWLKGQGSEVAARAFRLEFSKGGFLGTAAVSTEVLPLEVTVTREKTDDNQMEAVVLQGMVEETVEAGMEIDQ